MPSLPVADPLYTYCSVDHLNRHLSWSVATCNHTENTIVQYQQLVIIYLYTKSSAYFLWLSIVNRSEQNISNIFQNRSWIRGHDLNICTYSTSTGVLWNDCYANTITKLTFKKIPKFFYEQINGYMVFHLCLGKLP